MKRILFALSIFVFFAAGCQSAQVNSVQPAIQNAPQAQTVAPPIPTSTPTSTKQSVIAPKRSQASTEKPQTILNIESGIFTKPSDAQIKVMLTPLQYQVTQEQGTEEPFNNEYWNKEKPGLYVDIVSGEPLFSSADKYDSGTGWPSFTKPINPNAVIERTDNSLGMQRTEIVSAIAQSHLGHLFNDGPLPLGTRYCMNSASLRFIPASDLEDQGYGKYSYLFK